MIRPIACIRRATNVEAIHLTTPAHRDAALTWLTDHHIAAAITLTGALRILGPTGTVMVADMGQWLALDTATGEFTVWEARDFQRAHPTMGWGDDLDELAEARR